MSAVKAFHVTTFGCQMNEHDSERMKGMLESLGYAEAPAREDADLILFNTCSIREKADSRFVAHLHEAVKSQRDIGMAIGLLSAKYGCSTEQAWRTMLRVCSLAAGSETISPVPEITFTRQL